MTDPTTSTNNSANTPSAECRCPACGYCPHCGRRDAAPAWPYLSPYPWYQQPYWYGPYWGGPWVGSTSTISVASGVNALTTGFAAYNNNAAAIADSFTFKA